MGVGWYDVLVVKEKEIKELISDKCMLESEITTKIMRWLREQGCVAMKYHGSVYGVAGHSDVYGVLPDGKAFFIEVKTDKGTVTKGQEQFLMRMADNNAVAFVARNLDDVRIVMGEFL